MGVGGGDDHTSSNGFNHHLHQIKTRLSKLNREGTTASVVSSAIKSELSFFISLALRGKNKNKIMGLITDAKKNVAAATTICLSNQDNK